MNPDCPIGGCDRSAGNTTSGAIQIQGRKPACVLGSAALKAMLPAELARSPEASRVQQLFDSDALGQVAGLIHLQAPVGSDVIAEQLHRNHREQGAE